MKISEIDGNLEKISARYVIWFKKHGWKIAVACIIIGQLGIWLNW